MLRPARDLATTAVVLLTVEIPARCHQQTSVPFFANHTWYKENTAYILDTHAGYILLRILHYTWRLQCSSLLQTLACRAPHRGLCPTDRTPRLLLLDRTLCSVLLGRETAAPHAVGVEVVAEAELDATDEVEEAAEIVLDVEVEVKPSMIAPATERKSYCYQIQCTY